jgi:hypothetical protein
MIYAFSSLHLNKIIVFELELELEPHMLIKFYNEPSLLLCAMIPTASNMNPEIDQPGVDHIMCAPVSVREDQRIWKIE